ncbi:unnamed protein product, partial [Sphacelaria rigidula]
ARPGSRLVRESHFCRLCQNRAAGNKLLGVALQVVGFSDDGFVDEQLRQQFANVARQGVALWPGSNREIPTEEADFQTRSRSQIPTEEAGFQTRSRSQVSRTPWYDDMKTLIGVSCVTCLAIAEFSSINDYPRLGAVFMGIGILLLGVSFVLLTREYKILCFEPRVGDESWR